MNNDMTIGVVLLGFIFILLIFFTLTARNRINKIKKSGPDTARNLIKDLENDKE